MQAEAAFASKDYLRAASFYAKVNSLFLDLLMFKNLVWYVDVIHFFDTSLVK